MPRAEAILSASSLAAIYFSKLSHKRHDFRGGGGITEHKMCVLIFSTNFISNISYSKKKSARYCQKYKNIFM
jgi:hypothetical protein